jgi:serine/threonine protein phosphatase PrpC
VSAQVRVELLDGDTLLLCTNGLTDVVSDERIAEVLAYRRAASEQCALLVDLAVRDRTPDNVTVPSSRRDLMGSDLVSCTNVHFQPRV